MNVTTSKTINGTAKIMSIFELIESEICDKSEKDKQTSDIEAIELRKYVTCGAAGLVTRYVITIQCDQMVEPRLQSEQAENNIFRGHALKSSIAVLYNISLFLVPGLTSLLTLYIIIESLAKKIAVQVMVLSNQAKCDLQCPFKKHRKNCECCPGQYLSTSVY